MKEFLVFGLLMEGLIQPIYADEADDIIAQSNSLEKNETDQILAKTIVDKVQAAAQKINQKALTDFVQRAQATQRGREEAALLIDNITLKPGKSCGKDPQCKGDKSFLKKFKWEAPSDDRFLVFVSLSMADAALQALSKDIQKIGGRMILRGLQHNSFVKTQKRLMDLKIVCDIDPPLFDTFNIKHVPTFIHTNPLDRDAPTTPIHDKLKGNVSVEYALETFRDLGEVKGADGLLQRLKADA